MRTIWKFPLRVGRWISVPIGQDAKIVLAAIDPASGAPAIWVDHIVPQPSAIDKTKAPVEVEPMRPTRLIGVFGTGDEIDPDDTHLGSMIDRTFVWHVIERAR